MGWVILSEPWHFDKALLLVKEVTDGVSLGEGDFCFTHMWVQIHSLPLFAMTKATGSFIGGQVGQVLEVEMDENGRCIGRFLWVRVRFDISKPLKWGAKVRLGT